MHASDREWNQEYEQLLKAGLDSGEIEIISPREEQRQSPRFRIKAGSIWVKMDSCFEVVDASVSGISFQSDREFSTGQVLAITLAKAFKIETEVIDCKMVETDPAMLETRYLTRCRFVDEHSSVRFLVMLKAIDDKELAPPT